MFLPWIIGVWIWVDVEAKLREITIYTKLENPAMCCTAAQSQLSNDIHCISLCQKFNHLRFCQQEVSILKLWVLTLAIIILTQSTVMITLANIIIMILFQCCWVVEIQLAALTESGNFLRILHIPQTQEHVFDNLQVVRINSGIQCVWEASADMHAPHGVMMTFDIIMMVEFKFLYSPPQ